MIKNAEVFNLSLKYLARVYARKKKGYPDEEMVLRGNKRISMLISTNPLFIIDESGPFLMKYAKFIHEGDWNGLSKQSFDDEKKTHDIEKHISFIKHIFLTSTPTEQAAVGEHLQIMLSSYCNYALAAKASNN